MVVNCEQVWQEISNYLEGEVAADLRAAMDEHFPECKHCSTVLNGTRNVIEIFGDERAMEIPLGFTERLHRRLEARMPQRRGNAFGWMVGLVAAGILIVGLVVGQSSAFTRPGLRSEHAAPAVQVPPDLMVLVYDDGKAFHAPGCSFIHDREHSRLIPAAEAVRQGFVPCTRCMKAYLGLNPNVDDLLDDRNEVAEALELY
jgi:hypothetical protein